MSLDKKPVIHAIRVMRDVLDGHQSEPVQRNLVEGLIRLNALLLENMNDPMMVLRSLEDAAILDDMSNFDESKVNRESGRFANKDASLDEAGQVMDEPEYEWPDEEPPVPDYDEPNYPEPSDKDAPRGDEVLPEDPENPDTPDVETHFQ